MRSGDAGMHAFHGKVAVTAVAVLLSRNTKEYIRNDAEVCGTPLSEAIAPPDEARKDKRNEVAGKTPRQLRHNTTQQSLTSAAVGSSLSRSRRSRLSPAFPHAAPDAVSLLCRIRCGTLFRGHHQYAQQGEARRGEATQGKGRADDDCAPALTWKGIQILQRWELPGRPLALSGGGVVGGGVQPRSHVLELCLRVSGVTCVRVVRTLLGKPFNGPFSRHQPLEGRQQSTTDTWGWHHRTC